MQVRNRTAKQNGLEVSLFRLLSDAHPHAVVDLNEQYRMNSDIMLLSNRLIYGDRLRCGSDSVARRSLKIPDSSYLRGLESRSSACQAADVPCWLNRLFDERCAVPCDDTESESYYTTAARPSLLTQTPYRLTTLPSETWSRTVSKRSSSTR